VDDVGALRVGPRSAGAVPGPAAYGRGGVEATVTDADVVLGLTGGVGGGLELDEELAREACARLGSRLGLSAEEAARATAEVAHAQIERALRLVTVRRGHDLRACTLVAYGGAGPLHANALAKLMGSFPVIVPPAPGLLCAIGDLVADFRDEFAQTYIRLLADASGAEVAEILDGLGERATAWLVSEGTPQEAQRVDFTADMRYHRQGYEIPVALEPGEIRNGGLADLEERFNGLHEQLYGFRMPGTASEIVNLRAVGYGDVPKPELPVGELGSEDASGSVVDEHDVVFDGERVTTKIYDRSTLRPGAALDGPAIVTEFDSTTVVLPGYRAAVDANFNILISPNE
jgi:N-methylhydantoinase A